MLSSSLCPALPAELWCVIIEMMGQNDTIGDRELVEALLYVNKCFNTEIEKVLCLPA